MAQISNVMMRLNNFRDLFYNIMKRFSLNKMTMWEPLTSMKPSSMILISSINWKRKASPPKSTKLN